MQDLPKLPIHDVVDDVLAQLAQNCSVVLAAPPGAGKTTIVPLELLNASWRFGGKIILVQPRRLAARAVTKRMADLLGEKIGDRVGYRMRLDTRIGPNTIIEVVTEGVFTRMVLDQADLEGVACVIFDEFHERSLDADFGLALALDVQGALRDDLRILVMSATLDTKAVATLLHDAPVIISQGRSFPVDISYRSRPASVAVENFVASSVLDIIHDEQGSVLVFLPGQKEIRKVAELLGDKVGAHVEILPLYGGLTAQEQDHAIAPVPPGIRKIVLATSIAQTSLTIDGIRIVVDSGTQRQPVYEASTGITRLETRRVCKASADQRAGRAGRMEPGMAIRLWQKEQQSAMEEYTPPQILSSDLSGLILDGLAWGVSDLNTLNFITPPPQKMLDGASQILHLLGAIDQHGQLTQLGKTMRNLALPARLSAMVISAVNFGAADKAAKIAILLTEQGLGGNSVDLDIRLKNFDRDNSKRAKSARNLALRMSKTVGCGKAQKNDIASGLLLIAAFPDRIAKRRQQGRYTMVNGRGAVLDEIEKLAFEDMLIIADLMGKAQAPRILAACRFDEDMLDMSGRDIEIIDHALFDPKSQIVKARQKRRIGAITLSERPLPKPSGDLALHALVEGIVSIGLFKLPFQKSTLALRSRILFLQDNTDFGDQWPDMSDQGLAKNMDIWFAPYHDDITALKDISAQNLDIGIRSLLSWDQLKELDRLLPKDYQFSDGTSVAIHYSNDQAKISVRAQRLYGQKRHPSLVDGHIPLLVEILSPAGRPMQLTGDLPGFWAGSWKDVCADMRGRYPKHDWPDDPANAKPYGRV